MRNKKILPTLIFTVIAAAMFAVILIGDLGFFTAERNEAVLGNWGKKELAVKKQIVMPSSGIEKFVLAEWARNIYIEGGDEGEIKIDLLCSKDGDYRFNPQKGIIENKGGAKVIIEALHAVLPSGCSIFLSSPETNISISEINAEEIQVNAGILDLFVNSVAASGNLIVNAGNASLKIEDSDFGRIKCLLSCGEMSVSEIHTDHFDGELSHGNCLFKNGFYGRFKVKQISGYIQFDNNSFKQLEADSTAGILYFYRNIIESLELNMKSGLLSFEENEILREKIKLRNTKAETDRPYLLNRDSKTVIQNF